MEYKHITNRDGTRTCNVIPTDSTTNYIPSFVADYLKSRFELEGLGSLDMFEIVHAERGYQHGVNCRNRDFWKIRNFYIALASRDTESLEVTESKIKTTQNLYKLAYQWGREEILKKDPHLEIIPIKDVKIVR